MEVFSMTLFFNSLKSHISPQRYWLSKKAKQKDTAHALFFDPALKTQNVILTISLS